MNRLAVVAVGGNALLSDLRRPSFADQLQTIQGVCQQLLQLLEQGWSLAIVHGNGPQVGYALQRGELARSILEPAPLDAAVAETQGTLGYAFQLSLGNLLRAKGLKVGLASLITQVVVDLDDPAFRHPSKPVGGFLDEGAARHRQEQDGWQVMEDAGRGWRRVVASPRPREIVELPLIQSLLQGGPSCLICAGGGGIPVVRRGSGLEGVGAVIDKDFTSSLLARQLGAEMLLICTGVEQVAVNYGTPQQRNLSSLDVEQAQAYLAQGQFKTGSMRPKVEACLSYVQAGGGVAVICHLQQLARAAEGQAGTHIRA